MTVVVGTAGHIDHGKTTLLQALTGIDADRLPEERRRGLTIDIGYAHGSPDDGAGLDFVDVPGHDRLVGNMLVGVGEMDAALLVIAADDGPRAQTWEHLGLLDAMGVDRGVVAVTKVDLVDADRLAIVTAQCGDLTAGTCLAGAPIVCVSATTGRGLDDLRSQLAWLRDDLEARPVRRHRGAWLAVDRAFSMRGHGVVVTGSSRGAALQVGDRLLLRPGSGAVRVRGLHVHDEAVDVAPDPGRVGLNVAGVSVHDIRRGCLLTAPTTHDGVPEAFESDRLLVALRPPAARADVRDDAWPPRDGTSVRLHIGTDQLEARLRLGGHLAGAADDVPVFAMVRMERPVATAIGERFVLRRPPPAGLLAGGVVLDADVPAGRARIRLTRDRLERLHAAAMTGEPSAISSALSELHGLHGSTLAPDVIELARAALLAAVTTFQRDHADRPGLALNAARPIVATALRRQLSTDRATLERLTGSTITGLVDDGELEQVGEALRVPGFVPTATAPSTKVAADALLALLDQDAPPSLPAAVVQTGCSPGMVREMQRTGLIVLVADDLAWSATAFERLRSLAVALADVEPLSPARLRDETGTSRRYVLALLEELDRRGILIRTPAGHVRGPRA